VVDVLVEKAQRAAAAIGAKGIALGGGVAANGRLREAILGACANDGIHGYVPSRDMCTDNAAMIAAAGWHRLRLDGATSLDEGAHPNLKLVLPTQLQSPNLVVLVPIRQPGRRQPRIRD